MGAPDQMAAMFVLFLREVSARKWTILTFPSCLPQPGSVRMDLSGNIPPSQVISLAEGLGIQDVVVGKVSYSAGPQQQAGVARRQLCA